MSRIMEHFDEKSEIKNLIDDSDRDDERLWNKVQCTVEGDNPDTDVEIALEQAISDDAKVFPIRDFLNTTWYIVAKDGSAALQQIKDLTTKPT